MKPTQQNLKHITIKLAGMRCDGCENTIRKRLLKLDGIYDARANDKTGEVHLSVNESVFRMTDVDAAIRELGYEPKTN